MISVDVLTKNKIFTGVSSVTLAKIMLLTKEVSFVEETRIFSEGGKADMLYIILDGVMDLTFCLKIGEVESEITIDTKKRGDTVGWSALISPHIYTLSCVCPKPMRALSIHGEELLSLADEDPEFGYMLMRNIAQLIRARMKQIQDMFIKEIQRGISMP